MTITCVITDDEPMARKGLQSYVERVDFLSLTGVCAVSYTHLTLPTIA